MLGKDGATTREVAKCDTDGEGPVAGAEVLLQTRDDDARHGRIRGL